MPSVDELFEVAEAAVNETETNDIIEIDADTRTMMIPETERVFGVMSDEKGERKYFRCKRFVGNGIDLSKLSLRVIFQNASGFETGRDKYIVADLATDGEDYITFSWELSRKVTAYKGIISFIVCAIKTNTDGTITNEWNTTIANGIVLEGLEANGTQEQEEVARDYYNQLEAELLRVANEQKTEIKNIVKTKIDKPSTTDNNKIPRAKNGDVEWVDVGQPTDEQTNNAVEGWLNEHPEATTTVQDSSLDVAKFTDEAKKNILNAQGFVYISRYCVGLKMSKDGYYDLTEVIKSLVEDTNINTIFIDVNVISTEPIYMRNNISFIGNGKSEIKFPNNLGFQYGVSDDLKVTINNANIYNMKIVGNSYSEDYDETAYMINFRATCMNCQVHDIMIINGANGIRINAWVLTLYNIWIWQMKGIGLGIFKTDNTLHNFYINNCKKQGLYVFGGSNSRITDFKVLSCGADGVESVYIENLNRAYFHGVEVQDAYHFPSFVVKSINYSDVSINVDGIRTHFEDVANATTLASFESLKGNKIHIIATKYVSNNVNDIVSLSDKCFDNFISESFYGVIFSTVNYNNKFAIPSKQLIYNGSDFEMSKYLLVGADYLKKTESDTFIFGFVTGDVVYGGIRWNRKSITEDTKVLLYAEFEPSVELTVSFTNTVGFKEAQMIEANIKNKFIMRQYFPSGLSDNPAITFNKKNATIKVYKWKVFDVTDYTDEEISKFDILDIVE